MFVAIASRTSSPLIWLFSIIRILLMIPIYSMVSFLSYYYYRHAIYFEVLRDCYEAFAIASFFTLLCNYIAPNLHDQKVYFRSLVPVNWFWGVFGLQKCTGGKDKGFLRRPRSGLTWFNVGTSLSLQALSRIETKSYRSSGLGSSNIASSESSLRSSLSSRKPLTDTVPSR